MTLSDTAADPVAPSVAFGHALRRLYFVRFGFALIWAAALFATASTSGPFLTGLLVVYPLFDAAGVLWQLRSNASPEQPRTAERVNVVVSIAVAVALGVASTMSIAAALVVWGAWAIGAGIPQLIAALRNRRAGGQVPQILSGGLSVLAGASFLSQGLKGTDDIAGVGGYAALGGVFFLVSAIRLTLVLRRGAA